MKRWKNQQSSQPSVYLEHLLPPTSNPSHAWAFLPLINIPPFRSISLMLHMRTSTNGLLPSCGHDFAMGGPHDHGTYNLNLSGRTQGLVPACLRTQRHWRGSPPPKTKPGPGHFMRHFSDPPEPSTLLTHNHEVWSRDPISWYTEPPKLAPIAAASWLPLQGYRALCPYHTIYPMLLISRAMPPAHSLLIMQSCRPWLITLQTSLICMISTYLTD